MIAHLLRYILPDSYVNRLANQIRSLYNYIKISKKKSKKKDIIYQIPQWERSEKNTEFIIKIGFIGAGQYAQNHLQVLHNLKGAKIESILTTGNPRVKDVAAQFSINKIFDDVDQFLSQDNIDCFFVVVPSHHIKDVAMKCLSIGKPVFMEKPAGLSSRDTKELVRQAENYDTYGMVGLNRRFYSVVEHGLAALSNFGPIRGAILEIPESITKERESNRLLKEEVDNFMFRNSIHGIDLLHYICGDVEKVHSIAKPNTQFGNRGASFVSAVEHKNGIISTVQAYWDTPPGFCLKIIAEKAYVRFGPYFEVNNVFRQVGKRAPEIQITPDKVDISFRPGLFAQDLHFINSVRENKKPGIPACLLDDAHKTNLFIEQILTNNL